LRVLREDGVAARISGTVHQWFAPAISRRVRTLICGTQHHRSGLKELAPLKNLTTLGLSFNDVTNAAVERTGGIQKTHTLTCSTRKSRMQGRATTESTTEVKILR